MTEERRLKDRIDQLVASVDAMRDDAFERTGNALDDALAVRRFLERLADPDRHTPKVGAEHNLDIFSRDAKSILEKPADDWPDLDNEMWKYRGDNPELECNTCAGKTVVRTCSKCVEILKGPAYLCRRHRYALYVERACPKSVHEPEPEPSEEDLYDPEFHPGWEKTRAYWRQPS